MKSKPLTRFGPILWAIFVLAAAFTPSCAQVEFFDRGALATPVMQFESDRTESHFQQKVFQSIEGASGGMGDTGGGACGCS